MKSLNEFKTLKEEEKTDYSKFDALVRAGLANKAQIQRLHKILDKMGEERPVFNNADRMIMQNLFNKMVDLISNNKQIFNQTRRAVREDVEEIEDAIEAENIDEAYGKLTDPPAVLILKRKAIRVYQNNLRVALYYNERLKKIFTVPYSTEDENHFGPIIQAQNEETQIEEATDHMSQLQQIKDTHQHGKINHADGTSSKVDVQTAHALLSVHKALNDDNKKKFSDLIGKSRDHMKKASDFAWKHVSK